MILTVRGIPELYYGDEIGMPGGRDPDNRRDFPGGWTEDPQNAFTKAGRTREQEEVHEYVRSLLEVRAQHPALRRGKLWSLASDDTTYVFMRETEEERSWWCFTRAGTTGDFGAVRGHSGAGSHEFGGDFRVGAGGVGRKDYETARSWPERQRIFAAIARISFQADYLPGIDGQESGIPAQ